MITIRESELNRAYTRVNKAFKKKQVATDDVVILTVDREYTEEEKKAIRRGELDEDNRLEFEFDHSIGGGKWVLSTDVNLIEEEF